MPTGEQAKEREAEMDTVEELFENAMGNLNFDDIRRQRVAVNVAEQRYFTERLAYLLAAEELRRILGRALNRNRLEKRVTRGANHAKGRVGANTRVCRSPLRSVVGQLGRHRFGFAGLLCGVHLSGRVLGLAALFYCQLAVVYLCARDASDMGGGHCEEPTWRTARAASGLWGKCVQPRVGEWAPKETRCLRNATSADHIARLFPLCTASGPSFAY